VRFLTYVIYIIKFNKIFLNIYLKILQNIIKI
jgi:hypothetical protein